MKMFKISMLFSLVLGLSFLSSAQSLSSRTILNNLKPFWVFLDNQRQDLEKSTGNEYEPILEQSYNFIELNLRDSAEQLFLQIRYKIQFPGELVVNSFYCSDKKLSKKLKSNTEQMLGTFKWDSIPESKFELRTEQIEYLQIADRIVSFGNDLSITPSDYKSVVITSDFILLDQTNHMNSRSLDHKDSYYLRDLQFMISLKESSNKKENPLVYGRSYIGDMEITFSDSSAKASRHTGDKIRIQIENETKKYNQAQLNKRH